jgi:hypothetical protein
MVRAKPPFSHPNGQRRHQSRRSFRDDFTDQKNGGVVCEQQQREGAVRDPTESSVTFRNHSLSVIRSILSASSRLIQINVPALMLCK